MLLPRIEDRHTGWMAFAIRDCDKVTQATEFLMHSATGGPTPNYRVVSFNPYTCEILLDRLRYAGMLGFVGNATLCMGPRRPSTEWSE